MKYRCVSYPDFEPDHTWLRQILLFVDEVYRIVPPRERLDDSDDLKRLMEHCPGAVLRCPPEHYIQISESQAKLFGRALDQPQFRKVAESKKMVVQIGPSGEREVRDWEFLHIEKIGNRVRHELQKRDMIRPSLDDPNWNLVPRGVGGLVLSMVADQIARDSGFDAITDEPLAFALNGLGECAADSTGRLEGIVATAVTTMQVPREISLVPAKEYAELRKRHADVRSEFGRMVRALKEDARLDRIANPTQFRKRLDDIAEEIGDDMDRFRKTKAASKFNEWVPLVMTSLLPVAATWAFGPIPGAISSVFSFSVNAVAKLTKPTRQFAYPKVLQTLCAADDAAAKAALRTLA
jgi:hypothetical protein